ncbi:phage head closure protein [Pseudovibrio sp. Tun.PSC04-5.I4]|uniref:phage head closure protein n=1 Tax=Pseudovibrio sp. Tun.PSC04-5.I4 TaxID=1798213 RepID=UPI0013563B35|nr:phage head closure protein [Pseudovibrio sp. Tun.PSC04-5.I4]
MNEPLLLLRSEQTQATDGTITRSYQQVAMVWGEVKSTAGSEALTAGRLSSSYPLTITIRRRTDVEEGWRVERDDQSLRVKAVEPAGVSAAFMRLSCELEEGRDGGA